MSNKHLLALVALTLSMLGLSWSAGWEAEPDDNEQINQGDNRIREFKDQVRKRMELEHQMGNLHGATLDNGLHLLGSGRCFEDNAVPTTLVQTVGAYNAAADANLSNVLSTDEDTGAGTQDTGTGRCWLDPDGPDGVAGNADDRALALWSQALDNWVYVGAVNASVVPASQRFIDPPGRYNLLYNSSFAGTGGTGATSSTTVPVGWLDESGPATYAYVTPPAEATEGEGVELVFTGVGANSGIRQTLTNLKASTTYFVTARVDVGAAGDVCRLDTNGAGGTEMTDADATATTYQTLTGTFVTGAALDSLDVRLVAVAAGDICRVSHIAVYESVTGQNNAVSPEGAVRCRSTSTDNTNDAYNNHALGSTTFVDALVSCTVNVPDNKYLIQVTGRVHVDSDIGFDASVEARLRESCNGAGATTVDHSVASVSIDDPNSARDIGSASLAFVKVGSVAGDQCVYTVEAIGHGDTFDRNRGASEGALGDPVEQPSSYVETLLIPVR